MTILILGLALAAAAQEPPALGATGASAAVQAPSRRAAFAGVMAAVDTCLAATSLNAVDAPRLARDGWTEQVIDNIESAPHPYRLFTKARSGALILFNFNDDGRPHCHVMVVRTPEGVDPLARALIDHLGGGFLPGDQGLGGGATAMRVPGRPFVLVVRPQPDDRDMMADIQIMPTEGS